MLRKRMMNTLNGGKNMSITTDFLDEVREYEIDKYDAEEALRDELHRIIDAEFSGNFSTFMQNEVLNEDYGSLRSTVTELYNR